MIKKLGKSKIAVCILCLTMLLGTASLAMAEVAPAGNAATSSILAPQAIHYFVTATTYIRSGPGSSYSKVTTVYAGDIVWFNPELPNYNNGWTPVYMGSYEGYIQDSYLQEF
ncbi:MAG TPA: SH3 domain-containing protein [Syntrophomonadaceae bacterium]|nr:SH3 domain-containing protein [Syntrophomonadaceae bacterium]HQE22691.1 SH3 domain-containing protein [Syntrophomonadaceae bacterium]